VAALVERGVRRTRSAEGFLSHVDADKDLARTVARDLGILGIDVWLDRWELGPASHISERIEEAIRSAKYVMVIVASETTGSSKWMRRELDFALDLEEQLGTNNVIPVVRDQTRIPVRLKDRLYVDIAEDQYFSGVVRLAACVRDVPVQRLDDILAVHEPASIVEALRVLRDGCGVPVWTLVDPEELETIARLGGYAIDGSEKVSFSPLDVIAAAEEQGKVLSAHLEYVLHSLAQE
jgi:hypothetical protein